MSNPLSVQDLLTVDLPEEEITLPRGGVIRIRGLTRFEVSGIRGDGESKLVEAEALMLHHGMVEPCLSVEQARAWQQSSRHGETDYVTDRISDLSGLKYGQNKEYYKSLRGQSGAGVGIQGSGDPESDGQRDEKDAVLG